MWKYCMEDATKPYCKIAYLNVSLLAHKWMSGEKDLPLYCYCLLKFLGHHKETYFKNLYKCKNSVLDVILSPVS